MNKEEAIKKSDDALHELAEALRQGKSDTLLKYLEMVGRFHQYSFGNCILISLQNPDATMVAGFNKWKQLSRWVKKDEKGIGILAPMISKKKKDSPEEESEDDQKKNAKVLKGFRVAHVFDVAQTEGKELPEFAKLGGDPGDKIELVLAICEAKGLTVEFVPNLGGANGVSLGGHIQVVESLEAPQKFSTLIHELAHELLHRGDRRESTTKTIRETEAEAVAYVVCRSIGLECSTKAADYIQLWSGDESVLMQSLELIRNVAASILTELGGSSINSTEKEQNHES